MMRASSDKSINASEPGIAGEEATVHTQWVSKAAPANLGNGSAGGRNGINEDAAADATRAPHGKILHSKSGTSQATAGEVSLHCTGTGRLQTDLGHRRS